MLNKSTNVYFSLDFTVCHDLHKKLTVVRSVVKMQINCDNISKRGFIIFCCVVALARVVLSRVGI